MLLGRSSTHADDGHTVVRTVVLAGTLFACCVNLCRFVCVCVFLYMLASMFACMCVFTNVCQGQRAPRCTTTPSNVNNKCAGMRGDSMVLKTSSATKRISKCRAGKNIPNAACRPGFCSREVASSPQVMIMLCTCVM